MSGGVGTITVQLARHLGASVATTASATKTNPEKNLGADVVIDPAGGETSSSHCECCSRAGPS